MNADPSFGGLHNGFGLPSHVLDESQMRLDHWNAREAAESLLHRVPDAAGGREEKVQEQV